MGTGGAYHLGNNSWRSITDVGAPTPRNYHTCVWTETTPVTEDNTTHKEEEEFYCRYDGSKIKIKFTPTDKIDSYNVKLSLYNIAGMTVLTITEDNKSGTYIKEIDVKNLKSGIYFVGLGSGNYKFTKKLIILTK